MGDTRNNMQPTTEKAKGVMGKVSDALGGISGRRRKASKNETKEQKAQTFVDMLVEADQRLGSLLQGKQGDLDNEKGQELENARKLAKLEQMDYHLQALLDLTEEYQKM